MEGKGGGPEKYGVEENIGKAKSYKMARGVKSMEGGPKTLEWKGNVGGMNPVEWQPRDMECQVETC